MATSWTTVTADHGSSVSARGTVGTTVATMVTCKRPGARVLVQNQDTTATNTVTLAVNDTPVSGTDGIVVAGANGVQEFFLTYGDVLYGIAGADRAVDIIVTPYF